jgi:chromate reductase
MIRVAAFSGSLRKGSFTTHLIHVFQTLAPKTVSLELVNVSGLPLINQDLENDLPAPVKELHHTIEMCDAFLFATPEYNRSYSPVIKNAIDWGSRPEGQNKWAKKPAAVIGCSPYMLVPLATSITFARFCSTWMYISCNNRNFIYPWWHR